MSLSKSARYYRNNPEARKKKNAYDSKMSSTPKMKKKRAVLKRMRNKLKPRKDQDVAHTKNGFRVMSRSRNRGSKTMTAGDRRARGGKNKSS